MGRWMIQLFSLKQLEAMEQKDYDILKNTILKQLETNSEILKVLEKRCAQFTSKWRPRQRHAQSANNRRLRKRHAQLTKDPCPSVTGDA